jgi:hypothetical protein
MGDEFKTYISATARLAEVGVSEDITTPYATAAESAEPLENQRDLMKIVSILLSTGINNNDDVLLKEEVLPVRSTGANKPLNIEHNPDRIVGHMLRTYVTAKDGTIIPDEDIEEDPSIVPDEFDIASESVFYKFVFPDLAEEIRGKTEANNMFVSMEVWFTDYDYLVGSKVIARNEDTAPILDPILRVHGGKGVYKGHRVGRVLRNMLIGGIGLTEKPANVESVIQSIAQVQDIDAEAADNVISSNIIGSTCLQSVASHSEEGEVDMKGLFEEFKELMEVFKAQAQSNQAMATIMSEYAEIIDAMSIRIKQYESAIARKMVAVAEEEPEPKPEADSEQDPEPEPAADEPAETPAADPDPEVDPEPAPEPEADPQPEPEADPEPEPDPEPAPEPDPEPEPEPEKDPEPEPESKPKPESEPNVSEPNVLDDNVPDIDLENVKPVDPPLDVVNEDEEDSLTEKFGAVVKKMLEKKNPKWGRLGKDN